MSEEQQTISQILCAARQGHGLDIDTVYRDTSISLPVLNGMENERFDIIEPVFSRLALLSYADYLGLDPKPLLDRFDQENGPIVPPLPEAAAAPQKTTPGLRLPIPLDSTILRTVGVTSSALFILLLAISLFGNSDAPPPAHKLPPEPMLSAANQAASLSTDASADARPTPKKITPAPRAENPALSQFVEATPPVDSANEDAATITSTKNATKAPAEPPDREYADGVVLAVEAVDSTWVQILWDGTGEFQGIVPRGERRSWQADDHFLVFTGRAHGLRYWLNDQLLGNGRLGAATQVLRFRANPGGIEFLGPNFQSLTSKATTDQP